MGTIAGEDGVQYTFSATAVRGVTFKQLSLGSQVAFTPAQTSRTPRAEWVRIGS